MEKKDFEHAQPPEAGGGEGLPAGHLSENPAGSPTPAQAPQAPAQGEAKVQEAEGAPSLRYKDKREVCKGGVLGFFIGLAVIVPGVSGSAVAIIFRLYDKLLYALGNILRRFSACVRFLLPIAVGLVIGFVLGFFAVQQLIDVAMFAVVGLFAGLMLGAFPAVAGEVKGERRTPARVALFLVGLLVPVAISLLSVFAAPEARALEGLQWYHYLLFVLLGVAVAVTQVVPGLSATAILMMAGWFTPLMQSVSLTYWGQNPAVFAVYACLAAGFLLGLVAVSKALTKLFAKGRKPAFFAIAGLSLGSVVTMFFNPEIYAVYLSWGSAPFAAQLGLGIALFFVGAALSYVFVRYERKKGARN